MMIEKLTKNITNTVLMKIKDKILEVKEDYKWMKLFVDTGEFFIKNPEYREYFADDLVAIFSDENMKKMANELNGKNGFEFRKELHSKLYSLLTQYEVESSKIDILINHFMQAVLEYLENNMPENYREIFLDDWRKEEEKELKKIQNQIQRLTEIIEKKGNKERKIYSINAINDKIRKETVLPKMGLDFFEIDDEEFINDFHKKIEQERVYIVGKSREETTFCVLNEINRMNLDKITLVITSEEEWRELEKDDISGNILLPFFYAENIKAIAGNTNIFVYGEEEACYSREKIVLRKRTKKNLISSLERAGLDTDEAYVLVNDTHGLYVAIKKRIYNGAIHKNYDWKNLKIEFLVPILLCGKWEESEGDEIILSELSGVDYSQLMNELSPYMKGENPFVIEVNGRLGKSIQLASVEDAWEELDTYISKEIWEKFINLLYEVLIESEPIFEYPFEKHFETSIYAEKPDWSQTLKHGMIRSLIMRAYYHNHEENQYQVDMIVKKILDTINTKKRWGYISQYFPELCEAAPKVVLKRLENELINSTGMVELFIENDGDMFTGRCYYTRILWAIEQLLLQKQFVVRAVKWLWEMDSLNIKYNIHNSPQNILKDIFCAWINLSVLSIKQKMKLARWAMERYKNAWDIIYSELPGKKIVYVVH